MPRLDAMDDSTNVEILAGCLQKPTNSLLANATLTTMSLIHALLHHASRNKTSLRMSANNTLLPEQEARLMPTRLNALVLYHQTPQSRVAGAPELLELILLDLASECPPFLFTSIVKVSRQFCDTVQGVRSIGKCVWRVDGSQFSPSADLPVKHDEYRERDYQKHPVLASFDVAYLSFCRGTIEKDCPTQKYLIGGHVFAFSSFFGMGAWVDIHLCGNDIDAALNQSCADIQVFNQPRTTELHVRYQATVEGTRAGTVVMGKDLFSPFVVKETDDPPFMVTVMVKVFTAAKTIRELFQVARELKRLHPGNWTQRRNDAGHSKAKLHLAHPRTAVQELIKSTPVYSELHSDQSAIGVSKAYLWTDAVATSRSWATFPLR